MPRRRRHRIAVLAIATYGPANANFSNLLVRDNRFLWTGALQRLRLDPHDTPFAIWRISPGDGGDR
jgi:hypothetical protein